MPSKPTILAFDTSAAHCAAALLVDGQIVEQRVEAMKRGQAENLMPLLQSVLNGHGLDWKDCDAFGVGVGPGNFTGIRIAVSAARGLALATGRPAIGISSFQIAHATDPTQSVVRLPAPRGTFYAQSFEHGQPVGQASVQGPVADDQPCPMNDIDWQASGLAQLAQITAHKFLSGTPLSRPSPLYVRAADAAPPRDPAPKILA